MYSLVPRNGRNKELLIQEILQIIEFIHLSKKTSTFLDENLYKMICSPRYRFKQTRTEHIPLGEPRLSLETYMVKVG